MVGTDAEHRARGTPLSEGAMPNDLWCADFKGEFKLGNGLDGQQYDEAVFRAFRLAGTDVG